MMKRAVRLEPTWSESAEQVFEETADGEPPPPVDVEGFLAEATSFRQRLSDIYVTESDLRRMKQEGRP